METSKDTIVKAFEALSRRCNKIHADFKFMHFDVYGTVESKRFLTAVFYDMIKRDTVKFFVYLSKNNTWSYFKLPNDVDELKVLDANEVLKVFVKQLGQDILINISANLFFRVNATKVIWSKNDTLESLAIEHDMSID